MDYNPELMLTEGDGQDTGMGDFNEQPMVKQEWHQSDDDSNTDSTILLNDVDTDQGKSGTEVTEVTETMSGAMSTATTIPTEPSSLSTPVFPPIPQYGFTQINPYGCVWLPVIRPTHYYDVWRWRPVLPSIPVKQQESITETPEEINECPKESDNVKPINISTRAD